MRLIIEHKNTKRIIDGPFNICGYVEDIKELIEQLQKKVRESGYGWVSISAEQRSITDQEPVSWE